MQSLSASFGCLSNAQLVQRWQRLELANAGLHGHWAKIKERLLPIFSSDASNFSGGSLPVEIFIVVKLMFYNKILGFIFLHQNIGRSGGLSDCTQKPFARFVPRTRCRGPHHMRQMMEVARDIDHRFCERSLFSPFVTFKILHSRILLKRLICREQQYTSLVLTSIIRLITIIQYVVHQNVLTEPEWIIIRTFTIHFTKTQGVKLLQYHLSVCSLTQSAGLCCTMFEPNIAKPETVVATVTLGVTVTSKFSPENSLPADEVTV